jgi:hypothetical protein
MLRIVMSFAARATLLILAVSIFAGAQTRTLAVYSGPANELASESSAVMRLELQRLLTPAGIDITWKELVHRNAGENFDHVVVASFQGSCSVTDLSAQPAGALESEISLAETSISNGRILPFLSVDCGRLIRMLAVQMEPLSLLSRQVMLGRALGRVVAHEIYHIVAQTGEHHDTGVTKAALSVRDLTIVRFDFDPWSVARLRPPSITASSVTEDGNVSGR